MTASTLHLPTDFETYSEARRAGFLRMKELKEEGARVVGIFCTFVPTELIYAAGALPVGLCAYSEEPIAAAEADLPRNLCPLIKASYGFARSDTCPYFYFSDFVVGETTCDGKKKMFELLGRYKETYVMQLPHRRDDAALAFWREQILAFQRKLEDFYGISISEAEIRAAIRRKNRERRALKAFLELGKLNPAPMSGYEMGTRLDAGSFSFDLEGRCREIGWSLDFLFPDWLTTEMIPHLDRLRVPFTIAHMGMNKGCNAVTSRGFQRLKDLAAHGEGLCWIKLTAPYRISTQPDYQDVVPMAQALLEAAPHRIVWGSDFPHASFTQHNTVQLFNLLERIAPDEALRREILVKNPAVLYGFPPEGT